MDEDNINTRARRVVQGLDVRPDFYDAPLHKSTIYDTAWISMLSKPNADNVVEWVFPESFQFLLDNQQESGGWAPCGSKVDAILGTLAATLALKRHSSNLLPNEKAGEGSLKVRYLRAVAFLHTELQSWELECTAHLGYEILIPTLLCMLESEGIVLKFPGHQSLLNLKKSRLAKFDPLLLYGKMQSPILYFLEAFIGLADFKRLDHHKVGGSMMHSPSATAGYLMGLENWDSDCEAYLQTAICAAGKKGGVPDEYPPGASTIASVLEIFLESGFSRSQIITDSTMKTIADAIESTSKVQVASSPVPTLSVETQFVHYLLAKLQWPDNTNADINALQDEVMEHVNTNDTSFNMRCRVLKALMRSPRVGNYEHYAFTISVSLCDSWWTGAMKEGQNLSPYYSMMLFVQSSSELRHFLSNEPPDRFANKTIRDRVHMATVQILTRILSTQNSNGTWGAPNCAETTAYALLALAEIVSLPYLQVLKVEVQYAIARGREALSLGQGKSADSYPVWVKKAAFSSELLWRAFFLAAVKKTSTANNGEVEFAFGNQMQKIFGFVKYFSGLDHLSTVPYPMIKASVLEGSFYSSLLKAARTDIFPQTAAKEKDKYLEYIPIMWIFASTCSGLSSPPEYLWDMMFISMLLFLADEYMESTVAQLSKDEFLAFRKSLDNLYYDEDASMSENCYDTTDQTECSVPVQSAQLSEAISVFRAFTKAVTNYPRVNAASDSDKLDLRSETKNYLLHHVHQHEDNARFARQTHQPDVNTKFATPQMSYATWVHTVGAGHVSAPFTFAFLMCSMGGSLRGGKDCFSNVKQKLMAHKMNAHFGAFMRMYNDYGSIPRDAEEGNLNSVNFPEFFVSGRSDPVSQKESLLCAAKYERQCAVEAAEVLYGDLEAEGAVGKKIADRLRVYVGAGEQFSDLYLVRDVTNSVK